MIRIAFAAALTLLALAPSITSAQEPIQDAPDYDELDPVTALARAKQMQLEAIQGIQNSLQEYQTNGQPGTDMPLMGTPYDPALESSMKNLQPLLESKFVQEMTALLRKPEFTKAVNALATHPKKKNVLYFQLGFFVFMFLVRSWRLSIPGKWYANLWTRLWTFAVLTTGVGVVIPGIVLGEPYVTVLRSFSALLF